MSVVRKVFSDSAFTAFRSIVSIVRGLIVIPLITNLLGAGSYGVWVTIFAIVGLLSSTGGMHLHGSLVRYTSQEQDSNQTYSDVLFCAVALSVSLAGLVILLGNIIDFAPYLNGEVTNQAVLTLISAFLVFSSIILTININFPRAKGHVKLYDLSKLSRDILETLALVAVFLLGGGILAGMSVLAITTLLMNAVIVAFALMKFNLPMPNPANIPQYIAYGIPMIPKELSSKLLADTDKYLLLFFLGPAAVGIYAVAKAVSKPLVKLTGIFNPTLYPTISQEWDAGNFDEIARVYRAIFRFYSIIGIPATVGIILLSESLLTMISTIGIAREGAVLVPIFIFGYFLKGYDNSIRYILTSAERTDIIGGAVVVTVVINIILNIALIPHFGMTGAAIATLVSHVLLFAITLYYSFSLIRFQIPWGTITRSTFAALIMGGSLYVLNPDLSTLVMLVVYPAIGCILYFSVLILVGEFSDTELKRAKEGLQGVFVS